MNIIYCNCSYCDIIESAKKSLVWSALKNSSHTVIGVDDLCALVAENQELPFANEDSVTIIGCFERTIKNLLAEAKVSFKSLKVLNLLKLSAQEVGDELGIDITANPVEFEVTPSDWQPWFPIIDRQRCNSCKKCVTFCPFGVYQIIEEKIVVSNPKNCKNNCPACARVCPSLAIIFPKCPDEPICGAEVTDDKDDILDQSDDLHDILKRRSAFSKARKGD